MSITGIYKILFWHFCILKRIIVNNGTFIQKLIYTILATEGPVSLLIGVQLSMVWSLCNNDCVEYTWRQTFKLTPNVTFGFSIFSLWTLNIERKTNSESQISICRQRLYILLPTCFDLKHLYIFTLINRSHTFIKKKHMALTYLRY